MCSWLSPEPYVDPRHTVILLNTSADRVRVYCGVPATLTVVTRDQYANTAVTHLHSLYASIDSTRTASYLAS